MLDQSAVTITSLVHDWLDEEVVCQSDPARHALELLLWDMASIHASDSFHPGRHEGRFPTRRAVLHPTTKHLPRCDVAVFRCFKGCIQAQASATLARSVLGGTF